MIEECLVGEEASFFALSDGANVVPLATAQDHKRAHDGDTGPNTGGMGAYSPAAVMTPELIERSMAGIVRPTVDAMAKRGAPYKGVLYAGLMITADGPKLIEYNVRFGDPEAQVLMMRLESDLLELMSATAEGHLAGFTPRWRDDAALTVVMAAKGYPGRLREGHADRRHRPRQRASRRQGLPRRHGDEGRHARLRRRPRTERHGARRDRRGSADACLFAASPPIDWPDGFWRTDIGARAIDR